MNFYEGQSSRIGDFDETNTGMINWLSPLYATMRLRAEPGGSKLEGILLEKMQNAWPYPGPKAQWSGIIPHPIWPLCVPDYVQAPVMLEFVFEVKPGLRPRETA